MPDTMVPPYRDQTKPAPSKGPFSCPEKSASKANEPRGPETTSGA
jgi:hypothetical protein